MEKFEFFASLVDIYAELLLIILGLRNVMIITTSSFTKSFGFKLFFIRSFSDSSDSMSVFEKLRFRDGLLREEALGTRLDSGLTGEVRLCFLIPLGLYGLGLNLYVVKDPSNS